ncbi:MAG: DUF5716 family protein [Eubacteriales bacterium]|nr:DUF5716 family protein [Eubacteriales bacterium]
MIISKSPVGKYMVGIDFTDTYCQISWLYNKRSRFGRGFVNAATGGVAREPLTYSMVPGQEIYNIPVTLCKKKDSPAWLAGAEAQETERAGEGTAVTGLLAKARKDVPVRVDGEEYSPVSLLALFLRKCLSMLEPEIAPEQIAAVTITSPGMDYETEQILLRAFGRLDLNMIQVRCESHEESFFSYMLMQDAEQRRSGMMLCEYGAEGKLLFSTLLYNRRTSPVVYWTETEKQSIEPSLHGSARDRAFASLAQTALRGREISSVYLTGTGFEGGWIREAAAYLCRGRRVFMGENLFSKGAAYSALLSEDRPAEIPESVFLAQDALRSNIGIEVLLREQTGYHVLLDAGTKWFNAEVEEDFILENGREFSLLQTPVTGGEPKQLTVRLAGLPSRPDRTTRLRVLLTMPSAGLLRVQVTDLGFGEIFPSDGSVWEETFKV